jgi:hypothetical protein
MKVSEYYGSDAKTRKERRTIARVKPRFRSRRRRWRH